MIKMEMYSKFKSLKIIIKFYLHSDVKQSRS